MRNYGEMGKRSFEDRHTYTFIISDMGRGKEEGVLPEITPISKNTNSTRQGLHLFITISLAPRALSSPLQVLKYLFKVEC